ncbi:MAG: NAD-dependent aldehyde dehydrogenase [Firmicutes bacterium]|nr:NAD-dependent aldehyde dehydrogenase [Bacillota bacterium]
MQNIETIINSQRQFFAQGNTKSIPRRLEYLTRMKQAILRHEEDILEALKNDLNKHPFEAYATEIGMVLEEISFVSKHLRGWAKPKQVLTPITNFPSVSKIYSEPFGIILIMSPWNYPFQLTLSPLVGAIAAGNCAMVKPSNYSPNTSTVIEQILTEVFPREYVAVIQGGREANQSLLEQKFDYIFFTGSVLVGKTVMRAASEHLTPVTLELGGKSPCIVDETANLELAARRIVWGKFLNSGQTCVAPDYLLVHHKVKNVLIEKMKRHILRFYGEEACHNDSFPKIINEKHFQRLLGLIEGENIITGGSYNTETNQISPTILDDITWNSKVMSEEIFGPILPILEFHNLDEVIGMVNSHPKPLALYYFTTKKENEKMIISNISYGGGCINDTIMHLASSHMPFGGVGDSGMGRYHGKESFSTFSHKKSVLKKANWLDVPLRYPPYKNHLNTLKKLL